MAVIMCIAAVETEATLKFSRHIVREMALILCIVAVDMGPEAKLKFIENLSEKFLQYCLFL